MGLYYLHFNLGFYREQSICFVICSLLLTNFSMAQSTLDPYRWENRLVLLFATDTTDISLQKQFDLLTKEKEKVTDRDLIFFLIGTENGRTSDAQILANIETQALRKKFNVPENQFAILLIGKDGTEKLRRWEVIKPQEIFDLIDSMPMRRAEMRRGNK